MIDRIEIVQIAENHFAVRMTIDLGTDGSCSTRCHWSGPGYEDAMLYAERLASLVQLPVVDLVAA